MDQEVTLKIERVGHNGEGVGHLDGFTIFVDGALPGETVRAQIFERKKRYARAFPLHYIETSPHRVTPICPLFGKCGGCQIMHLNYNEQLKIKRQRVVDALERIGKFASPHVLPCIPSPKPLYYRNKIQLPAAYPLRLGLYEHNSHNIVEIEKCFIHCDLGEKAYGAIRKILKASPLTSDQLRAVLIKTAINSSQVLVVLVTNAPCDLKILADQMMDAVPEIKGVVQNINPSTSNVILGSECKLLAGVDSIHETLCNLTFKISPASFFQVNTATAELLYQKVLEFAALTGSEDVLDAYCGVGTLSLLLARHAKQVFGVECVPEAIADAKENAELNHIPNAHFNCANAEDFIGSLQNLDLAILNPPRKGCEQSFLKGILNIKPKTLLYVSCDPATLARDLQILCETEYRIEAIQPFDMFPQTAHVECLVSLKKI